VRLLLAALMLLTGLLGQVGHAWAHGGGTDPAAAWLAALQAERDWLSAGAADEAGGSVQVFGAAGRHSHGDSPAHQHDGPDGLLADHAHGVAFLLPAVSGVAQRALGASLPWALFAVLAGAQANDLDRPPRNDATPA
jgi:hypothetical protein